MQKECVGIIRGLRMTELTRKEFYKEYQYERTSSLKVFIPKWHKHSLKELSFLKNTLFYRISINEDKCTVSVIPVLAGMFYQCSDLTRVMFPVLNRKIVLFPKERAIQIIGEIDFLLNPERLYL